MVITSSVSSSVFHSLLCFWELQFHILLDITNEVMKDLFLFLFSIIFLFVLWDSVILSFSLFLFPSALCSLQLMLVSKCFVFFVSVISL